MGVSQWAGGRSRQISPDNQTFIVETANSRPEKLGRPFTRWSIRKLADYLGSHAVRRIRIGRERLRQILHRHRITFQRTKTWKESTDPQRDVKLARIEYVSSCRRTGARTQSRTAERPRFAVPASTARLKARRFHPMQHSPARSGEVGHRGWGWQA